MKRIVWSKMCSSVFSGMSLVLLLLDTCLDIFLCVLCGNPQLRSQNMFILWYLGKVFAAIPTYCLSLLIVVVFLLKIDLPLTRLISLFFVLKKTSYYCDLRCCKLHCFSNSKKLLKHCFQIAKAPTAKNGTIRNKESNRKSWWRARCPAFLGKWSSFDNPHSHPRGFILVTNAHGASLQPT